MDSGVTCSPRPTLAPTPTETSTPTGPGENKFMQFSLQRSSAEHLQCMYILLVLLAMKQPTSGPYALPYSFFIQPAPVYEDIVGQSQNIELKENVAYGPVQQ